MDINTAPPQIQSYQQGVALLGGIDRDSDFSFGIIGLIGLQASMLKGTTTSQYRSEASYIAQQQVGMMWADPCNLAAYSTGAPFQLTVCRSGTVAVTHQYSGRSQMMLVPVVM